MGQHYKVTHPDMNLDVARTSNGLEVRKHLVYTRHVHSSSPLLLELEAVFQVVE